MIQSGPGGVFVEAFTGLFSVCESAKAIVLLKFPLKSGPSCAIVKEKTNFTDRHVHVLSIFVKKNYSVVLF